jgi:hypothetical protein
VSEQNEQREPDLVDKAFSQLDHALDVVHDRVLRPIFLAGRAVAFGFIVVLMSIVLVVALLIALVRLFDVYVFASHQWLTYVCIGATFVVAGLVIWRFRRPNNVGE